MRLAQQLPSARWNRSRLLPAGAVLFLLVLFALPAQAAAPTVDDRAGLFSGSAVTQANQTLQRIYQNTTPHKQVFVETLPSLPDSKQASAVAAERFRQHNADGLLILLVKNPHKLAVTVGRSTQDRFHDAEAVRSAMLEHFRRDDYNGGLLAGLQVAETGLTRAFSANARPAASAGPWGQSAEPERESATVWPWLLLLGGGGLIAFLLWRRSNRGTQSPSRGYGQPLGEPGLSQGAGAPGAGNAAAGGGGGGWGRSLLGGVAGAVAGNWLFDRFFRGDQGGSAHAAEGSAPYGNDTSSAEDHGEVGTTAGGHGTEDDWGGSGGDTDFGSDAGDSDW